MKIKRAKIKKQKSSFSTIELIVSMSIIVILGGIFLLNYRSHTGKVELNNAANTVAQEIRKAQDLAMAQTANPGTSQASINFAVKFSKDNNYVELFADKDEPTEANIEDRFFSPSIKISNIDPVVSGENSGWVSFYRENLSTKINNSSSVTSLEIELCIKSESECTEENTKTVIVNKKGMVDIQ